EKRRTGEFPPLLLSSYKKQLPESPILFNETSGERFLTFFHAHSHLSLILLEINAENITFFKQGMNGRINVVSTRSSDSSSVVRVEAHNVGDTPAIFTALVTQCTHGVSNSDTSSAPVRPRRSILLLFVVQFGTLDIREDVRCTVWQRKPRVSPDQRGRRGQGGHLQEPFSPIQRCSRSHWKCGPSADSGARSHGSRFCKGLPRRLRLHGRRQLRHSALPLREETAESLLRERHHQVSGAARLRRVPRASQDETAHPSHRLHCRVFPEHLLLLHLALPAVQGAGLEEQSAQLPASQKR
ncbi:unnamed protein product, partial [Ixodes persulcatus]